MHGLARHVGATRRVRIERAGAADFLKLKSLKHVNNITRSQGR